MSQDLYITDFEPKTLQAPLNVSSGELVLSESTGKGGMKNNPEEVTEQ